MNIYISVCSLERSWCLLSCVFPGCSQINEGRHRKSILLIRQGKFTLRNNIVGSYYYGLWHLKELFSVVTSRIELQPHLNYKRYGHCKGVFLGIPFLGFGLQTCAPGLAYSFSAAFRLKAISHLLECFAKQYFIFPG